MQKKRYLIHKLAENPKLLNALDKKSDRGYKYLFSVKRYFLEFLSKFVKEAWDDKITEDDVELVSGEYILNNFSTRHSDVVYKIRKKEREFYFVLLELQSKNDKFMSFRLLEYMVEIWRRYIKDKEIISKSKVYNLPLIIPCVLYTGKSKWNSSKNFNKLFKDNKLFEKIIPSYEYVVIDINDYSDDELLEISGIIGKVMYIDKGKNITELKERLEILLNKIGRLRKHEQESFFEWVAHLLAKNNYEMYELSRKIVKEDDETMLADLMLQLREEWEAEARKIGMEKGRKEGRKEGRREGVEESRILWFRRILENNIGVMPNDVNKKIDKMTKEQLDVLEEKIFNIKEWSEILEI